MSKNISGYELRPPARYPDTGSSWGRTWAEFPARVRPLGLATVVVSDEGKQQSTLLLKD
jgi:hypothetical protein